MQNRKADHLESQVGCPRQTEKTWPFQKVKHDFWTVLLPRVDLISERILWKLTWLSFTLCHSSSCCLTWGTENTILQPLFALVCLTGTGNSPDKHGHYIFAGILQILYMHIFLQIKNVRNPGFELKLKLRMNLYGYSILRRCILVGSIYLQ